MIRPQSAEHHRLVQRVLEQGGTLTGDAEAKHIVIFLQELLQQSALPCTRRAAEHYGPGSSHS